MQEDKIYGKRTYDDYEELSEELKLKAKTELNEDPYGRQEKIKIIQHWLAKNDTMKILINDVPFIVKFLRNCKFDVENTKKKICNRFRATNNIPKLYLNRDPKREEIQKLLNAKLFGLGPDHPNGEIIVFAKLVDYHAYDMDFYEARKLDFIGCEMGLFPSKYQIHGAKIIADAGEVGLSCIRYLTPKFIADYLKSVVSIIPFRCKGVYTINLPAVLKTTANYIKLCLPGKLRKRAFFFGYDYKDLYNHIPKECLPYEYGGTADSWDTISERAREHIYLERESLLYYDENVYKAIDS